MPSDAKWALTWVAATIAGISIGLLIYGVSMLNDNSNATSGPMAVSDGCCFGPLWILASCLVGSVAVGIQMIALGYFGEDQARIQFQGPPGSA